MTRTVLITGGAEGIGWATARLFAARGNRVVIADLSGAQARAAELGPAHQGITLDVTDEGAVIAAFAALGRIDVLVNNAGIGDTHLPSTEQQIDSFRRVLDVHLAGAFLMAREAGRQMIAQGGGAIVNLSSIAGVVGLPRRNAYGAAKAGVAYLTRCLAAELGPHGIRVNAIAPGIVQTARLKKLDPSMGVGTEDQLNAIALRRFAQPEDMANVMEFLVTDLSGYVTGQVISACGGVVMHPN